MAQRVVGGGELYVGKKVIDMDGVAAASVQVPPGANMARIQPQLFATTTGAVVLINRGSGAVLSDNVGAVGHLERHEEPTPAGLTLHFRLVDPATGSDVNGSTLDVIVVAFYTNVGGRQTMVGG